MKMINELYIIKYRKVTYSDDDFNGRTGRVEGSAIIEFNYQDCIDTYVSYCECGYDTTYEKLDDNFSNTIKALDQLLILNVRSLIGAEKRGALGVVLKLQKENSVLKLAIECVFRNSIEIYNVNEREEQIRLKYDDDYREKKLSQIFESETWKMIEEMEEEDSK